MSRCYPFSATGYVRKSSNNINMKENDDDALILSIKPERENEKAIAGRGLAKSSDKKNDRKREKKEKKSDEKKHQLQSADGSKKRKCQSVVDSEKQKQSTDGSKKRKLQSAADSEKQKYIEKFCKADKSAVESKAKQSLQQQGSEVLERSALTEEHGRPIDSQNASCSSDSTGNSGKRNRHSSPPQNSIQSNGNKLRIRLTSSKRRDEPTTSGSKGLTDVILPSQNRENQTPYGLLQPCSNIVRTDASVKQENVISRVEVPSCPASISAVTLELVPRDHKESTPVQGKIKESVPKINDPSSGVKVDKKAPSKKLSSRDKKMLERESLYNNLFQNLAPPSLEFYQDDDDEDWLFGSKYQERQAKRLRGSDVSQGCADSLSCSASAVMQPRAHFLPDVGIYALPFTVPY